MSPELHRITDELKKKERNTSNVQSGWQHNEAKKEEENPKPGYGREGQAASSKSQSQQLAAVNAHLYL
jgi:hypothetical protein